MSDQTPVPPHRFAIAPILVFPLVGPAILPLTAAIPLAVIGLFVLGPGGLLYYFMLAAWWMPGFYELLGGPFLLSGVFVSIAGWVFRRNSILVALLATELAFATYFGLRTLVPGDAVEILAPNFPPISSGFFRTPWSVIAILLGAACCWWVTRWIRTRLTHNVATFEQPSYRETAIVTAALVAGAVGLATLLTSNAQLPAAAWGDCSGGGATRERISGCTVIIERGDQESVERRITAYMTRGGAYHDANQNVPAAITDYTEAIRLDPKLASAYAGRGVAYEHLKQDEQAIADIDMAFRLDENISDERKIRLHRSRGFALFRKGEFDRAIADHTEEMRLTPHYADGRLHRAAVYLAMGQIDRALADCTDAIRIEPFHPRSYIARGTAYAAQGDDGRALEDFDEAIKRLTNHWITAPAYRRRAEILEKRGNLEDALAGFETAVSLDPSDKEALAGRDRVRTALGR